MVTLSYSYHVMTVGRVLSVGSVLPSLFRRLRVQGKGFRARGFRAYPGLVTSCLGKEMKVPSAH